MVMNDIFFTLILHVKTCLSSTIFVFKYIHSWFFFKGDRFERSQECVVIRCYIATNGTNWDTSTTECEMLSERSFITRVVCLCVGKCKVTFWMTNSNRNIGKTRLVVS